MSTVDSILKEYLLFLSVVFLINIDEFCKPQPKLDHTTLRQGSRERNNATEQIKIVTLAMIFSNSLTERQKTGFRLIFFVRDVVLPIED